LIFRDAIDNLFRNVGTTILRRENPERTQISFTRLLKSAVRLGIHFFFSKYEQTGLTDLR